MLRSVLTGTGSYIPPRIQSNSDFVNQTFYNEEQQSFGLRSDIVVEKFRQITGIEERRYITDDLRASDIGSKAGAMALCDSGVNAEEIGHIIVAHNFGNVVKHTIQSDAVPSLASCIKHSLGIHNPDCVAYDILFGCPGWVQGLIQADAFFKAGMSTKALIIGTETLSRVIDKYDRDSMIFSDGAGAAVLEYKDTHNTGQGILGASSRTYALDELNYINMGMSYNPGSDPKIRFIKMKGRKVYEFAMKYVPAVIKDCLEKSNVNIRCVKKILIHQANEKMDEGIVKRVYQLYDMEPPENVMPMNIRWLGNSSVATIPTLFDMVLKNQISDHRIEAGDIILFASVGAGMNINAICYKC